MLFRALFRPHHQPSQIIIRAFLFGHARVYLGLYRVFLSESFIRLVQRHYRVERLYRGVTGVCKGFTGHGGLTRV